MRGQELRAREGSEVAADNLGVGVVGAKGRFEDSDGLLKVGSGGGVVAHGIEQAAQVVQASCGDGDLKRRR